LLKIKIPAPKRGFEPLKPDLPGVPRIKDKTLLSVSKNMLCHELAEKIFH
jgi:hypothetical protein